MFENPVAQNDKLLSSNSGLLLAHTVEARKLEHDSPATPNERRRASTNHPASMFQFSESIVDVGTYGCVYTYKYKIHVCTCVYVDAYTIHIEWPGILGSLAFPNTAVWVPEFFRSGPRSHSSFRPAPWALGLRQADPMFPVKSGPS